MSQEIIERVGFQPPVLQRRALRRRNTVFAQLVTTVALVISIAVVATVVTMGIGCAAPYPINRASSMR